MKEFNHECFLYEDDLQKVMLPMKRIVCPTCGGDGLISRTDIDSSKIYDSCEADGDYEGMAAVRRGDYMIHCTDCNGRNVVDEPDMEFFAKNYPKEYEVYCLWLECEIEHNLEVAYERRMNC